MMARLAPEPLSLTTAEEQLLKRHSTPQQIALRARIILLANDGYNHREIARELEISRKMARLWRARWQSGVAGEMGVLAQLQDTERSGSPGKFEPEQIAYLFKLACDDPGDYGRPISHWTNRELADELMQQQIVASISPRHVGRLLSEADIKPHQSGYWLNPPPTTSSTPKSLTSVNSTKPPQNVPDAVNGQSVSMK
jgi:putative transposase